MKNPDIRNMLIESTIKSIATNGLDKTTTKSIAGSIELNEAYIYSHFKSKEGLLEKTFDVLDQELVSILIQHGSVIFMKGLDSETRCRIYFNYVWQFLLGKHDRCLAFIRYYYSPYFIKNSFEAHRQRYLPVVEIFNESFVEEADTWMILNHTLHVILDSAIKVHTGQMPNSDKYMEHVFSVAYRSIEQYFKKKEGTQNG